MNRLHDIIAPLKNN